MYVVQSKKLLFTGTGEDSTEPTTTRERNKRTVAMITITNVGEMIRLRNVTEGRAVVTREQE